MGPHYAPSSSSSPFSSSLPPSSLSRTTATPFKTYGKGGKRAAAGPLLSAAGRRVDKYGCPIATAAYREEEEEEEEKEEDEKEDGGEGEMMESKGKGSSSSISPLYDAGAFMDTSSSPRGAAADAAAAAAAARPVETSPFAGLANQG